MADYIEGKRPIIEALRTDVPIEKVLMADNVRRDGMIDDIVRKAKRAGTPVIKVSRAELDEKSERGSHQGVIAVASPYAYVGVGDLIRAASEYAEAHDGRALLVVLDHITDAGNLGAIVRSANAVGASGVVIPNKRSARIEASTYKSSAGAISHVPVAQVSNVVQTLERLKKEGFWVCSATEYAHDTVWKTNLKGKIVLVMGNESEGVSKLVQQHSDLLAKLPMEGQVASLNVAQAATACMYEWLRQNS
ncbi:23S rRNA (guanosine(2251)-2'-O)-methyltransferase RlmB [Adlercreutzia sp. ZJ141]|uniref:23S rRNA (guanosine(2251)-2'-O)-methyltransferase RlmB n=1 Tax=Adlercreutzia sp. ZJ141 TaxID=2709406 RepID=UPI0013ED5E75|nr:23S rRNA (guanosine(2251)-2'-O)-methyltransferase RlmB [Adlercreutzia sp. ZJ141]